MKQFVCRAVEKCDYDEVLSKWWNEWGFPVPPENCLPKTGLIVGDEEGDLYGGFLFFTDSNTGWMEWVVSNKEASVERRRGALKVLIDLFSKLAKDNGMEYLFTSTVRMDYVNSLCKCGFEVGDRDVYQLVKRV